MSLHGDKPIRRYRKCQKCKKHYPSNTKHECDPREVPSDLQLMLDGLNRGELDWDQALKDMMENEGGR